jgi:signal transduction histidine kinase
MLFLRLHLEMLERGAPPEMREKLADARQVAERIITEIRRVVAALSPSVLQQLGLAAAIRHLSANFRKLHPIKLHVRLEARCDRLPRALESTIYRVVQECYQNIAKHSQASHVNLSLGATDTVLELNVEDDGIGFEVDPAVAQPKCFGLKGMRERVALWGGRLEIRSSPGHGAKVCVRLPIPGSAASSGSG